MKSKGMLVSKAIYCGDNLDTLPKYSPDESVPAYNVGNFPRQLYLPKRNSLCLPCGCAPLAGDPMKTKMDTKGWSTTGIVFSPECTGDSHGSRSMKMCYPLPLGIPFHLWALHMRNPG